MYAVNEYVVRANQGVCLITEIGHPDFQDPKDDRMYYVLIPTANEQTKIYVPIEPEPVGMRKLISREKAMRLIKDLPDIPPITIENEKLREQQYRQSLRSNDPYQLASIIKTLYMREQTRSMQGKKSIDMDRKYFRRAEELLYSELAMVLEVDEDSIPCRISTVIKENVPKESEVL